MDEKIEERVKRSLTVGWFGDQMKVKLRENEHKGGWDKCGRWWLLERLKEEVAELEQAMKQEGPDAVIREAADVGNYSMMIADITNRGRGE